MVITILLWHLGTTLVLSGVLVLVSLVRWVSNARPARKEPVRAAPSMTARTLVSGGALRG